MELLGVTSVSAGCARCYSLNQTKNSKITPVIQTLLLNLYHVEQAVIREDWAEAEESSAIIVDFAQALLQRVKNENCAGCKAAAQRLAAKKALQASA